MRVYVYLLLFVYLCVLVCVCGCVFVLACLPVCLCVSVSSESFDHAAAIVLLQARRAAKVPAEGGDGQAALAIVCLNVYGKKIIGTIAEDTFFSKKNQALTRPIIHICYVFNRPSMTVLQTT